MAFTIIKGEQLTIEGLIIMLYGDPSTGKTSTALTADKPVLFDFDSGAHRSYIKSGKDIIRINKWEEITSQIAKIDTVLAGYNTIIIDTVETCLDFIRIYVENQDYKLKANKLQMYGRLKDEFYNFLSRITKLGKNIILIAHSTTDEQNGVTRTVPKITGGSKDITRQKADFVGYMFMQNNKRVLNFSPTDYYEGKNSANFPVLELPDYITDGQFMQDKITLMRDALTAITRKQGESVEKLKTIFADLSLCNTVDGLNAFYEHLKTIDGLTNPEATQIRAKMSEKTKELNCEFIKEQMKFVAKAIPVVQSTAIPVPAEQPAQQPTNGNGGAQAVPSVQAQSIPAQAQTEKFEFD